MVPRRRISSTLPMTLASVYLAGDRFKEKCPILELMQWQVAISFE
jgi:hypothetical protein